MRIMREWAMPNKNTFSIKPINKLVVGVLSSLPQESVIIDPFANNSVLSDYCTFTNDLDPDCNTTHHMDALDFLKVFEDSSVGCVLFDPPYSPRQVSECYRSLDLSVNMQTTQSSFWGNIKKEIARITKQKAVVVTCGWNSGGIGKSHGFTITDVLLVAHGGWHNDTIVTVEKKQ